MLDRNGTVRELSDSVDAAASTDPQNSYAFFAAFRAAADLARTDARRGPILFAPYSPGPFFRFFATISSCPANGLNGIVR